VIELSGISLQAYEVYKVNVIGALCLIDGGNIDWKIMAIEANSELNKTVKDINGYMEQFPDHFKAIKDWLRVYKVRSHSKNTSNYFLEDNGVWDKEKTVALLEDYHSDWAAKRPLSVMKITPKEVQLEKGSAVFVFDENDRKISFWHDIPLQMQGYAKNQFNMVMEISSVTKAKMEISRDMEFNPIVQDEETNPNDVATKRPRDYAILPIFNYGALPQTWEDPNRTTEAKGEIYGGDQDPIDIVEISGRPLVRFDVYKVNIIGALKCIDSGEVDWKLLAIEANSPLNKTVKTIVDFRTMYPEKYNAIIEWFKTYKIHANPNAKPNHFLREDEDIGIDETIEIIQETHDDWKRKRPLAAMKMVQKEVKIKGSSSTAIYLFDQDGNTVSWWNDVPMKLDAYDKYEFNMVMEISSSTKAKMEISRDVEFNPIIQDLEQCDEAPSGKKLRDYAIFPIFNYGAIPQTWEDPNRISVSAEGTYGGDQDPIDIVEVSGCTLTRFDVYKIKI
jgi:inorganic pyrophosphatase